MKKIQKGSIIDSLTEAIDNSSNFYLADISDLNAADTYKLRKACFDKKVKLQVVKNTLLKKASRRATRTEVSTSSFRSSSKTPASCLARRPMPPLR